MMRVGIMPPPTDVDRYNAFRGQIEHESTLIGVRLGWLIAAEAFLFAAYASVLRVGSGSPSQYVSQAHVLFSAIPIAGITLSACMAISIWAALWAMGKGRDDYGSAQPDGLPSITVKALNYYAGSVAPFVVPPLTVAIWIVLLALGG